MAFLYLLLSLVLVSCGSVDRPPVPVVPEPEIPDRQLKEIVVYANYYPDEEESRPSKYGPSMATRPFQYSSDHYCYNKKKEKEPVYDKSLKARLYDKKSGKLLVEDFLRKEEHPDPTVISLVLYLPYREVKEGKIHIVWVKEGKEDIIKILNNCCASHKSLAWNASAYEFYKKRGGPFGFGYYRYNKELDCYISPGIM